MHPHVAFYGIPLSRIRQEEDQLKDTNAIRSFIKQDPGSMAFLHSDMLFGFSRPSASLEMRLENHKRPEIPRGRSLSSAKVWSFS